MRDLDWHDVDVFDGSAVEASLTNDLRKLALARDR